MEKVEIVRGPLSNIYGSDVRMVVSNRYGASSNWESDALIRFDLSSIPFGTVISSAKLNLYYYDYYDTNPAGRVISCYRITNNWNENTVTWNKRPSYASTVTSYSTLPSSFGWVTWDVKSDVQDFINSYSTSYGWWVMDENYWGRSNIPQQLYMSKEYGDNIPYLEIWTL